MIRQILHISFILFLNTSTLFSLSFSNNKGMIITNEKDLIIRLLDSPNSSIKTAEAIFVVSADSKKCFSVINDIKNYSEFMPNISESKFVLKSKQGAIFDFIFEVMFIDTEYTLLLKDSIDNNTYHLDWTFVKGELNDSKGSWKIKPTLLDKNISEVYYKVYLDPGTFIPDWLTNKLTARSIPDMVVAIRKRVKEK